MSRNWRTPGPISLVVLAAAGWIGARAGVPFLSAQGFATSKPKPQTSMQKVQPSPKKMQFDQMKSRAMSGKPPGGQPGSESNALLERLKKQYESKVEAENARLIARVGRLGTGLPSGSVPPASRQSASTNQSLGGGKKGPPLPGASASGPAPMGPPDPCVGGPLEIKEVLLSPPLDPGEKIQAAGCGFGPHTDPPPGDIFLFGDFPGGRLKLTVEGWFPTGIIAKVPMVTGVYDMPNAWLQVVRGGQFSNRVDVGGFRATRDVKQLRASDIEVTCDLVATPYLNPAQLAECNGATTPPPGEAQFLAATTIGAKHAYGFTSTGGYQCNDYEYSDRVIEGIDTYTVKRLINGWTILYYAWWWRHEDDGYAVAPQGFSAGSPSSTIKMKWGLSVNPCSGPMDSDVRYRVDLFAVGPKGIPYR